MDLEETFKRNQEKTETTSSKEINAAAKELLDQKMKFEGDRVEMAYQSKRTAWKVAGVFAVIAIMAVAAVMLLTPLKELIPFVIKVDNNTGQIEIVKQHVDGETISYGESLDKYFTSKFIVHRNSYDWNVIQSDYNAVALMADRSVLTPYVEYMNNEDDDSPLNKFGEFNSVEVKIKSITFLPSSTNDNMVAQVAFVRTVLDAKGVQSVKYLPTQWKATLTFDYLGKIKTEDERLINPLCYRVTSYREDRVIQ